jgi:hypothetical protein
MIMRRVFLQFIIVLFCVWHMFAVAIFSLPREATDTISVGMRQLFLPIVTPYMYTTSQWQLWDMFAPEPLRQIIFYRLEKQTGNTWTEITTMKPGTYAWWRHAAYFKYFINVIGSSKDPRRLAQSQFLQQECAALSIPPGTLIRLVLATTTIPIPPSPGSSSFWKEWNPQWDYSIQALTLCNTAL